MSVIEWAIGILGVLGWAFAFSVWREPKEPMKPLPERRYEPADERDTTLVTLEVEGEEESEVDRTGSLSDRARRL